MKTLALSMALAVGLTGCATLTSDTGRRYFGDDLAVYATAVAVLNDAAIAFVEHGDFTSDELALAQTAANSCTAVLYEVNFSVTEYEAGGLPASSVIAALVQLSSCLPDLFRLTRIDGSPLDGLSGWVAVAAQISGSAWPAMVDLRAEIRAAEAAGTVLDPALVQATVDGAANANARLNAAIERHL